MNGRMTSICNNFWRLRLTVAVLALALTALNGCGPLRDAVTPAPDPKEVLVSEALASLRASEADFSFFATRFSGTAVLNGQEIGVGGNIRIKNDSAIYVSVSPLLGIEIGRLLFTPDTVKMINRIDNTYYVGDMAIINDMLNTHLDFHMLQALLVGNDFSHFSDDGFRASIDDGRVLLHSSSRAPRNAPAGVAFQQNLWLDAGSYRIEENLLYEPASGRSLRAIYHNTATVDGRQLPGEISLVFTEPGAQASLRMRYSRTSINEPQAMRFSIPGNYRPINF